MPYLKTAAEIAAALKQDAANGKPIDDKQIGKAKFRAAEAGISWADVERELRETDASEK